MIKIIIVVAALFVLSYTLNDAWKRGLWWWFAWFVFLLCCLFVAVYKELVL